jgi:hypothetical protein
VVLGINWDEANEIPQAAVVRTMFTEMRGKKSSFHEQPVTFFNGELRPLERRFQLGFAAACRTTPHLALEPSPDKQGSI